MMLPAGQRIEARFGGKLKYFPGRIVKANDDGTYEIRYDDGDTEISVAPDLISAPSPPGTFKVGEAVQSRFGGWEWGVLNSLPALRDLHLIC